MDPSWIENMNLHCTDALPNNQEMQCIQSAKSISEKVMEKVEEDLEEFEKISILFLISADNPGSYEKILGLCKNLVARPNIIAEFVKNNFGSWSEKLLEALCIIDNREILKNLGYSPSDIVRRYRQNIGRCTVKINPATKVLYKLFETMNAVKAKLFLQYIYEEDGIKSPLQDNHHLELHALYWLHVKYITISPDGNGDLSKLLKHLKRLDYFNELIYHDVQYFSTKSSDIDVDKCLSDGRLKVAENCEISTADETLDHTERYVIKKGKCVIINEENFTAESEYEKRDGSERDSEDLRRTFAGLGFFVKEYQDLTKDEITRKLKKVSENFDEKIHDCLVVAILSHGYEGGIISSDGYEISVEDIEDAVCTWHLQDVAKILIVQACQGKITGDASHNSQLALDGPLGISERKSKNIHRHRNLATFMSTMKGFYSIRHKKEGSWFIQAVCEVLSNGKSISIGEWSTKVTKKVRSKVGCVNDCRSASQIPVFITRLEAVIYFPPYEEKLSQQT